MKHFLKLEGFPRVEAMKILEMARTFKAARGGDVRNHLQGQSWAMIFSKPSTRTRVSFEVAVQEMGGNVIFLNAQDIQLGRGECIEDTARVLGRMTHGAIIRTFAQSDVEIFAEKSGIPTINALTDGEHPCQVLSDIFTYTEKRGSIQGKRVAFIGDAACNVARSWVHAAEIFKFQLICAAPEGFQTDVTNPHTAIVTDPVEAARGAAILYTDVWVSMGKESEMQQREEVFQPYQINEELVKVAAPNALVMHCLPAYRGKEISETFFESCAKDIFDQAENRLHTQKAILYWVTRF